MTNSDTKTYHFFSYSNDTIGDGGTHSVQRVGQTHTFSDSMERHPLRLRSFYDIQNCGALPPVPMMLNEKVKKIDVYLMAQFAGLLISEKHKSSLLSFTEKCCNDPVPVELSHERLKRGFPTLDYQFYGMRFQNVIASAHVNWTECRFARLGAIYTHRPVERSLPFEETNLSFADFDHHSREYAPLAGRKHFVPTKLAFSGIDCFDIFHWDGSFFLLSDECKSLIMSSKITGLRFTGRKTEVEFS